MNTKLLLKLTLLAAWAVAPTSLGASWDGDARDRKFSSAKNWSDNKVPTDKGTRYVLDNGDQVTLTQDSKFGRFAMNGGSVLNICLLYTSPSPRDQRGSRMPSSA